MISTRPFIPPPPRRLPRNMHRRYARTKQPHKAVVTVGSAAKMIDEVWVNGYLRRGKKLLGQGKSDEGTLHRTNQTVRIAGNPVTRLP
jgi:hypothetical protein